MVDDFMTAEERRRLTDEKRKVVEISNLVEKYIEMANEEAEDEANDGSYNAILFIAEPEPAINRVIFGKLNEFLKQKGYVVEYAENSAGITVRFSW